MKTTVVIVLAVLLSLGLSGCMSTGFLGFLATTKQVDQKLADQEAKVTRELEQKQAELERVKQELAEYRGLKEQAKTAVEQMSRAQASVEELLGLAGKVEARLAALPAETLQKLIDILQQALGRGGI